MKFKKDLEEKKGMVKTVCSAVDLEKVNTTPSTVMIVFRNGTKRVITDIAKVYQKDACVYFEVIDPITKQAKLEVTYPRVAIDRMDTVLGRGNLSIQVTYKDKSTEVIDNVVCYYAKDRGFYFVGIDPDSDNGFFEKYRRGAIVDGQDTV
jgi:hypothetical protein